MISIVARRQPAFDELRIKPVATLLQIAAIRHLRNDVRGAEHVAEQAEGQIQDVDFLDRPLVAGEVNDLRGDRRELRHPQSADVLFQKLRAAGDVLECVFGAVLVVHVVDLAQIADVVKQCRHHPETEQLGTEGLGAMVVVRTLVSVHQARHRERYVKRVLKIVITGIAGPVARILALVQPREIPERTVQDVG